jgi:N-acetylneuraminic acid mutarotase
MIVWGGLDVHYNALITGGRYDPNTDSWTATSTTNAPAAGGGPAVWTGSEMIVWVGGATTGGRYNPTTDSWTAMSTTNAPTRRGSYTAVWTGSELIIWGGACGFHCGDPVNTGARYNPNSDSWTATSTRNAPEARVSHTAVWIGNEMIVWGGMDVHDDALNTGGRYNPSTDRWTNTGTDNAPTARYSHTAVSTDSEMIVWGEITTMPSS